MTRVNQPHDHPTDDRCCVLTDVLGDVERQAATLGRNRALIADYTEDELRAELAYKFRAQQAVTAGIDAYRAVRKMLKAAA